MKFAAAPDEATGVPDGAAVGVAEARGPGVGLLPALGTPGGVKCEAPPLHAVNTATMKDASAMRVRDKKA